MLNYVKLFRSTIPKEDFKTIFEYFEEYDTPEKRTEALLQQIVFQGCHSCGNLDVHKRTDGRSVYCSTCKKESYVTAGTFFEKSYRLDAYHAIIKLLDRGVRLNANQAAQLCDCSYETTWLILKRLEILIGTEAPTLCKETPSAVFSEIFTRRSDQTPAQKHPRAEGAEEPASNYTEAEEDSDEDTVSDFTEDHTDQDTVSSTTDECSFAENTPQTGDLEENVFEPEFEKIRELLKDEPMTVDELHVRTGLSVNELSFLLLQMLLSGLIEQLPGDYYKLKGTASEVIQITSVQIIEEGACLKDEDVQSRINYIRRFFFGIGRKYLGETLALYWFLHDKIFWGTNSLWQKCLRSNAISRKEVKSRTTPRVVTFALVSTNAHKALLAAAS